MELDPGIQLRIRRIDWFGIPETDRHQALAVYPPLGQVKTDQGGIQDKFIGPGYEQLVACDVKRGGPYEYPSL